MGNVLTRRYVMIDGPTTCHLIEKVAVENSNCVSSFC